MTRPKHLTSLQNKVLIATPQLNDSFWEEAVIYICTHNDEDGAMGMVVNHPLPDISFAQIAEGMDIDVAAGAPTPIICAGGPVEANRGFVLHSGDYQHESTMQLSESINLSASADIVGAIAEGRGPQKVNFCLGYAGWEAGQLEHEITENSWLIVEADSDLLFDTPQKERYKTAMQRLGVDLGRLVHTSPGTRPQ